MTPGEFDNFWWRST